MNPSEIVGKTYNKWHVDSFAYTKEWEHYFNCTCECGVKKVVNGRNIVLGKSRSCGCDRDSKAHKRYFIDLTGNKYNKLTCIKWERRENGIYWYCQCECNNFTWVEASNLKSGAVKSCGCAGNHVNRIHGMSRTRLHKIWSRMIARCFNPNVDSFEHYGGRGITVCSEWMETNGFINFMNWSYEHGYKENLSIDRIDNNKGYSPDNCRWVTQSVQMRNTRTNPRYELNSKPYTIADLADIFNIPYQRLHRRIHALHWDIEEAVGLKPHVSKRKRDEHGRFQTG